MRRIQFSRIFAEALVEVQDFRVKNLDRAIHEWNFFYLASLLQQAGRCHRRLGASYGTFPPFRSAVPQDTPRPASAPG